MRPVQESFNRKLIYNPSARCICSHVLIIEACTECCREVVRGRTSGGVTAEFVVLFCSIRDAHIQYCERLNKDFKYRVNSEPHKLLSQVQSLHFYATRAENPQSSQSWPHTCTKECRVSSDLVSVKDLFWAVFLFIQVEKKTFWSDAFKDH